MDTVIGAHHRLVSRLVVGVAVLALSIAMSAGPVAAQSRGASATATASATVVRPVQVICDTPLDFGALRGGHRDGTVVVSTSGSRQATGGAELLSGGQGNQARLRIAGEAGRHYRVGLPSQLSIAGTRWGRGAVPRTLTASNFEAYSVNARARGTQGTLDGQGRDLVYVGGTIAVPAGAPAGLYRAELPVTVDYN